VRGPILLERLILLEHVSPFPHPASYTNFNSVGLKVHQMVRLYGSFQKTPWTMKMWGWDGRVVLEIVGEHGADMKSYQLKLRSMDGSMKDMGNQPLSSENNKKTVVLLEFMLDSQNIYVRK